MDKDTICAISTPIGTGGISIVRMSGENALRIALQIFHSKNLNTENIKPRYFYLGKINSEEILEKCMLVYFKAPYSYTGEDLVELQCHGGVLITRKILELLINTGARLAEGGEFTKRAFINGKLSLDEAEGVIDTINAESESELKASSGLVNGNLHKEIASIQNTLTDLLSEINVTFDFPENDDEEITSGKVLNALKNIESKLQKIINTASTGLKLKTGNKVVIVGKPNVGKSSLMNAMLGMDRAIVTNIQGTTRDVLEETYIYKGVRFNLIDTAGLHDSTNLVESIGIDKAKQALSNADIVLFVLDGSEQLNEYDKRIFDMINNKNTLVIINKSDLKQKINKNSIPFYNIMECSSINKSGIDGIKQKIFDLTIDGKILGENIIITNVRHSDILNKALKSIKKIINELNNNCNLEVVALELQDTWATLGEITGVSKTEEIIANIFSKFCVGK